MVLTKDGGRGAACSGQDPNDWMEVTRIARDGQQRADYDEKRALCCSCPVREECLHEALANPELVGMWGGTTADERRKMRRGVGTARRCSA